MSELLDHPAVQAGVAPFVVGLVVAALTLRGRMLGLAIGAAFCTVIALTIGFTFESLTSMRRLELLALAAVALIVPLELAPVPPRRGVRAALAAAAGLGGVWAVLRVLQQQETVAAVAGGVGAALFMAALVESGHLVRDDPLRAAGASLMLGLAAGVLGLLGASVTLGQVGIAIGAGAGAALLAQTVSRRRAPLGWTLALPATVTAGLVALLSVATGVLRWYCLLPLLLVAPAARLAPAGERPLWLTAVLTCLVTLVPAAFAVVLAWFGPTA